MLAENGIAQASAEKLEHTGPAKKERAASQCHRENSWQVRQREEKKQSCQSRAPDHERGESQGERELHLGQKEGDQSESMERKGWTSR